MICNLCNSGSHEFCKRRNDGKQGPDCDCQHRELAVKKDEVKDGVPTAGD